MAIDDETPSSYDLRSRKPDGTAMTSNDNDDNKPPSYPGGSTSSSGAPTKYNARNPPAIPTRTEILALAAYPALLVFGTLFSVLSPQTRNLVYDPAIQGYHEAGSADGVKSPAPSYFARKDNLVNVIFVKQGWAWITVAFFLALFLGGGSSATTTTATDAAQTARFLRRSRATVRWVMVTTWWWLVTQWCFGPPIIDRGFRFTGGKCEVAMEALEEGKADTGDVFTAAACRASGGKWRGGHDISGHVFLLVLGSFFLLQEVGWPAWLLLSSKRGGEVAEERSVVMSDGAVKGAGVEAVDGDGRRARTLGEALGLGGKFAIGVYGLCLWMLLMTAIYFHTWFEKFTGLLTAFVGIYAVYYVPRFVPGLRALVGMPGI